MKKVCIQCGHYQIEQITSDGLRSWRSPSVLKKSTGASGERDWHWNEWMPKLRDRLIQAGVHVYIADAIYNQETYNQEYDLWISGHYDGGGTGERCMISAPNRDTKPDYLNDAAQGEAERFCAIWKDVYPAVVGVPNRDDIVTAGMRDYYAFDYVGYDTPSVIIEHFNNTSPKGNQLKNNSDLVVEGDYKAILKFLGLKEASSTEEEEDVEDKVKDLESQVKVQAEQILEQSVAIGGLEGEVTRYEKELEAEKKLTSEARAERNKAISRAEIAENKVEGLEDKVEGLTDKKKVLEEALAACKAQTVEDLEWHELLIKSIKKLIPFIK